MITLISENLFKHRYVFATAFGQTPQSFSGLLYLSAVYIFWVNGYSQFSPKELTHFHIQYKARRRKVPKLLTRNWGTQLMHAWGNKLFLYIIGRILKLISKATRIIVITEATVSSSSTHLHIVYSFSSLYPSSKDGMSRTCNMFSYTRRINPQGQINTVSPSEVP